MMILQAKHNQCKIFRDRLVMTGTLQLVEDTDHEFWARGKYGNGLNMLGIQLMEVRGNMQPDYPQHPHYHGHSPHTAPRRPAPSAQNEGPMCWYCGENNHLKDSCRHGKTIYCRTCGGAGHKTKVHN